MHGGFSLIQLFTRFAMLGAEWVMWVLVALSVASVAVILERARFYNSLNDDLEALSNSVRELLRGADLDGARARLRKSPSPAALVALAGLDEFDSGLRSAEESMAGAQARIRMNLERYLAFLGTVGNNAPFVGLFGTVIGIIQAFDKLRASEEAVRAAARTAAATGGGAAAPTFDTGAVMGTLAEALVATAIGLMVAIPAVAAFNYFQRKVKSIMTSTDTLTHVVTASLAAQGSASPYRGPVAVAATVKDAKPAKADKADKSEKSSEEKH